MLRKTGFRALVLSLALAAAAVPAATAQPSHESPPAPTEIRSVFERFAAAFRDLFDPRPSPYERGVATACESGSIMDPDGCPRPQSGSIMDPDG